MPIISMHLLAEITGGIISGNGETEISILETDSRKIIPSPFTMFIAIKGSRHDGHKYLKEINSRGITNFLIDDANFPIHELENATVVLTKNSVVALQLLAARQRTNLKMPVVAITGSNGKTVVKEWLFQCLSHAGMVSRSPKSYNSQIGVPLSIWLLNSDANWSIIEAGISQRGEMMQLERIIHPEFGIITNIGQAHQENFLSLQEKACEKLVLFNNVKAIYYCADHKIIQHEIASDKNLQSKTLVTWSQKDQNANLFIKEIQQKKDSTRILAVYKHSEFWIDIPFTDEASLENCMHIINFLLHQGFTYEYIIKALSQLSPVAMRLEQLSGIGNSTIINDSYNSDLNSLKIALDFLSLQKHYRKQTLILSDLRQTGLSLKELYQQVGDLVNAHQIDRFITIGNEISSYLILPNNTERYISTQEFLREIQTASFENSAILIKGAREFEFERIVKVLSEKKHTTTLEINLNHLVYNLNHFRNQLAPGTRIMVMVKALAYGSGGFEIANLLQHEKVDYLGVAFTDEGITLRNNDISLPVMVMSPTEDNFQEIIDYNLEPEIYSFSSLERFSQMVSANQLPEYPIHLKIDTGMHRLGFMRNQLDELIKALLNHRNLKVKAIFSHLAVSDNPSEDAFTRKQFEQFNKIFEIISISLGYKPLRHILNSAGIERFPEAHFDMVRLGIGLHGISSTGADVKAVSRLKTRIIQTKHIPVNDTVGYNRRGKFSSSAEIGIIPIGYADGLDRKLGNRNGQVIINHQSVDFVGDICMDLSMIDITGKSCNEGDEVIVFGPENPIQKIASQIGTIPYEVLTNISSRVKRIYINE